MVDVKSTGLFATDPVLKANGATTVYWKTGHSYIKRKTAELGALAGFEKSGHFFFNPPLGRGYDDGLAAAAAILSMLDRNPDKKLCDLKKALPVAYTSLTMSPHCADEVKYGVVDEVVAEYQALADARRHDPRPQDRRRDHRQRRARGAGGRLLGAGPRLVQQAGDRGGGGEHAARTTTCAPCSARR